jgi:hypothetical protein
VEFSILSDLCYSPITCIKPPGFLILNVAPPEVEDERVSTALRIAIQKIGARSVEFHYMIVIADQEFQWFDMNVRENSANSMLRMHDEAVSRLPDSVKSELSEAMTKAD